MQMAIIKGSLFALLHNNDIMQVLIRIADSNESTQHIISS